MSLRAIATLVIAVVLGLAAVLIINSLVNRGPKAPVTATVAAPATTVVVAAKPIARGVTLTPDLLKLVDFPKDTVPENAFTTIAQLTGPKDVQRIATRDLGPGEPVLSTRVTPPGGKLNLSDALTQGMQAVTLRTNDVQGVAGFVLPGDHVDLLLTRGPIVQVILENIKVVAIDQNNNEETNVPAVVKAITLEVTPSQAQTVTLAQTLGTVSLSLRHVQDSGRVRRIATSATALDLKPPRRRTEKSPYDYGVVRVTRATDTTVYQLSSR